MISLLSQTEKIILCCLLLFVLTASGYLWHSHYLASTKLAPAIGGTYTEGILADSASSLKDDITALTNVGLTRLGSDGSIHPAVATSWQVSQDGKSYTFQLQNQYSSPEIADYLKNQKGSWSQISITTPDTHTIIFNLNQPYGLFLASTLHPVLPYGPFMVKNQTATSVTLIPNTNQPFQKPYLKKIVFKTYKDLPALTKDLNKGKISGTAETPTSISKSVQKYSVQIPRYTVAFFNTQKLTDQNIRKQIISGQKLSQPVTLNLVRPSTTVTDQFTKQLLQKWSAQNIKVNETVLDNVTFLNSASQLKTADVIIYSFNTGYYDDLYPFWHSTQTPPTGYNYSYLKDKSLDRLLENARLTLDDTARQADLTQVKGLLEQDAVAIFAPADPVVFYLNKSIKNVSVKYFVSPADRFSFADQWYLKTKRVKK